MKDINIISRSEYSESKDYFDRASLEKYKKRLRILNSGMMIRLEVGCALDDPTLIKQDNVRLIKKLS